MFRAFIWLLACLGLVGCQQAKKNTQVPIRELIESYKDAPLGKSINDVSKGLTRCSVLVATEGVHEEGQKLRMKCSLDNQGRQWAYIYTDESELVAAFPDRVSPYVKMRFGDIFGIVEKDSRFGGIFINHSDKYYYLIPRDVFGTVRGALDSEPDWKDIPLK